jgi:cysteine synthase
MDENKHPHIGHETTDVNVWAVGKFAIGLVVVCVVSIGLLFGLLKFFQSREETSVANTVEPTKIFPQPQLQKTPIPDLKAIRAEEDKLLNGYAWVDQPKGVVRIPVDRAIEVLAQRGLPSRGVPAGSPEVPKK